VAVDRERPIRILRIIARLNIGGPAIQAITLTAELPKDSYKSLLVSGNLSPGEGNMAYLAEKQRVHPLYIRSFGRDISLLADPKAFVDLRQVIKRVQPHIIHMHTAKAGTLGRLAVRSLGSNNAMPRSIKLVHTFHGHIFEGYFPRLVASMFIQIERFLARFTDRIIVLSSAQKEDICRKFKIADDDKVRIIPLGFDLSPFSCIKGSHGRSIDAYSPNGPLRVGIVGRLAPVKDHVMLIEAIAVLKAMNRLKRFQFVIVGDGQLKAKLVRQVQELGLGGAVQFLGWQEEMASIYEGLDAVVLTSRNEGTPVALIEAMASSRPVVATAVGGVPDLLGEIVSAGRGFQIGQRGLMVRPKDDRALARALIYLADYPPDMQATIARAKEFVLGHFAKERLIADVIGLYDELLANN
jgi:glycosyltransferase involved in cell wall biosynthesis